MARYKCNYHYHYHKDRWCVGTTQWLQLSLKADKWWLKRQALTTEPPWLHILEVFLKTLVYSIFYKRVLCPTHRITRTREFSARLRTETRNQGSSAEDYDTGRVSEATVPRREATCRHSQGCKIEYLYLAISIKSILKYPAKRSWTALFGALRLQQTGFALPPVVIYLTEKDLTLSIVIVFRACTLHFA